LPFADLIFFTWRPKAGKGRGQSSDSAKSTHDFLEIGEIDSRLFGIDSVQIWRDTTNSSVVGPAGLEPATRPL
jgi:hypothetical protein